MDHIKIIKRAWNLTWTYRVLWIFGIIMALTAGGSPQNPGDNVRDEIRYEFGQQDFPNLSQEVINTLIGVGIALACVFVILIIVGTILHYVSQTALIRMVTNHEDTGKKVGFKEGFRLGWNRSAFRLFMINLLVTVAFMIVLLLGLAIAGAPLLLLLTEIDVLSIVGVLMAVGLFMLLLGFLLVVTITLGLALQMVYQACVIEELGVIASIKRGWQVFKKRLWDILLMGLILFALGIVYSILMIPVVILLVMAGLALAGLPATFIGWVISLFASGEWPWIIAIIIGLPVFLLIVSIPTTIIGGIVQVFVSSTWTLTYREAVALNHFDTSAQESALVEPV